MAPLVPKMSFQFTRYMEEVKKDKRAFEELKDHLEAFEKCRDEKSALTFETGSSMEAKPLDQSGQRIP